MPPSSDWSNVIFQSSFIAPELQLVPVDAQILLFGMALQEPMQLVAAGRT